MRLIALIPVILFAAMLAGLVWIGQHRRVPQARRRHAMLAALLPFLLLFWYVPANLLYRGWAAVTGLDGPPVIRFASEEPLPNGYELSVLDAEYSINPKGGGEALVSDIEQIAVDGAVVFGITDRGPFVFDTSRGPVLALDPAPDKRSTPDFESLRARRPLVPVHAFHLRSGSSTGRSGNFFDALVWGVLWLLPPIMLTIRWSRGPVKNPAEGVGKRIR